MDLDTSSISSLYSSYITNSASNASSLASKVSSTSDYSNATDDELMEVCKEFEAYFVEQVYKEMMKTVGSDDDSTSGSMSTLTDYYKDMFVQEIASEGTETQSLGLAQQLYEQMKRNYDI